MDRKTILAFLLIALVIIFYPVYMQKLTGNKKSPVQKPAETQKETPITPAQTPLPTPELLKEKSAAVMTASDTVGAEKIIVEETPLYSANGFPKRSVLNIRWLSSLNIQRIFFEVSK